MAGTKPATESDMRFAEFWEGYPRKVAKQPASKVWQKLSDEEQAAALNGLPAWTRCDQWRDLRYVPYPVTFLNQRRWEDPPAEQKQVKYDLRRFAAKKS